MSFTNDGTGDHVEFCAAGDQAMVVPTATTSSLYQTPRIAGVDRETKCQRGFRITVAVGTTQNYPIRYGVPNEYYHFCLANCATSVLNCSPQTQRWQSSRMQK